MVILVLVNLGIFLFSDGSCFSPFSGRFVNFDARHMLIASVWPRFKNTPPTRPLLTKLSMPLSNVFRKTEVPIRNEQLGFLNEITSHKIQFDPDSVDCLGCRPMAQFLDRETDLSELP